MMPAWTASDREETRRRLLVDLGVITYFHLRARRQTRADWWAAQYWDVKDLAPEEFDAVVEDVAVLVVREAIDMEVDGEA